MNVLANMKVRFYFSYLKRWIVENIVREQSYTMYFFRSLFYDRDSRSSQYLYGVLSLLTDYLLPGKALTHHRGMIKNNRAPFPMHTDSAPIQ
jgi:hypothetical protein